MLAMLWRKPVILEITAPLIIVLFYSAWSFSGTALANTVIGVPIIIDGDTVSIGKERIRLHGIDAPEQEQTCMINNTEWPCGRRSTTALRTIISDKVINCYGYKRDRYRRLIAVCHCGEIELNAYMVENGWALSYRRYSTDYVNQENTAKINSLGIWRGKFSPPWTWRKNNTRE